MILSRDSGDSGAQCFTELIDGARKDTIVVGIVRRPHQILRDTESGGRFQRNVVGFARAKALTSKILAWCEPALRHQMTDLGVEFVKAREPEWDPQPAGLEERNPQPGIFVEHASANQVHARHLLFERMRNNHALEEVAVTVESGGRHIAHDSGVKRYSAVEFLRRRPK